MNYELKNRGFSLTEVLLAVGTLAVGMIFIAGVFPVAIHFTTIATERTIAAVVADEAFAKIRLYAMGDPEKGNDDIDLDELEDDELKDFNDIKIFPATDKIDPNEFVYPSTGTDILQKQYCWSALCRLTEDKTANNPNPPVQVTVFVCRKTNPNLKYFNADFDDELVLPVPVPVEVKQGNEDNELEIKNSDEKTFINDGYTIVDDETGQLYRILERYPSRDDDTVLLDRDWGGSPTGGEVWVVPPPLVPGTTAQQKRCSGRYPCIAIYQKVIRF